MALPRAMTDAGDDRLASCARRSYRHDNRPIACDTRHTMVRSAVRHLHLCDTDPAVADAMRAAFAGISGVFVHCDNILSLASDTLISPANSLGLMDGGIDQDYLTFFGSQIQRRVRDAIARRPEGRIPIGSAELVATGHARIRWLVLASTMEVPEPISDMHCYRALRAALRAVLKKSDPTQELWCPGLGTGIGAVAPTLAARAMADAWRAHHDGT